MNNQKYTMKIISYLLFAFFLFLSFNYSSYAATCLEYYTESEADAACGSNEGQHNNAGSTAFENCLYDFFPNYTIVDDIYFDYGGDPACKTQSTCSEYYTESDIEAACGYNDFFSPSTTSCIVQYTDNEEISCDDGTCVIDDPGQLHCKTYSTLSLDTTAPNGTVSYSTNAWTKGNVTVNVACSDSGSGCENSNYSKIVTSNGSGNIQISDKDGNTRNIGYTVNNIDKSSPSYAGINSISNSWVRSDIVTIGCSDSASGCKSGSYQYRTSNSNFTCNNGGTWITGYYHFATSNKYICTRVKDTVLNSYKYSSTYYIGKIDRTAPVVSATNSSNTWKSSNITIILNSTDSGGSNISQSRYSWSNNLNSACTSGGTSFTNGTNISKSTDGSSVLYLCSRDNSGNTNTWSGNYRLDKISPIISATNSSNTWKSTNIGITLNSADSGGSILSQSRYSWSNNLNSACTSGGTSFTNGTNISKNTDGSSVLYLCNRDNAGNVSTWSGTYKLDKTAPVVDINLNGYISPNWTNNNVNSSVVCNDATSGCDNSTFQMREETTVFSCDSSGTWGNNSLNITTNIGTNKIRYICARAQDITGNYNYSSVYTIRIDKHTPEYNDIFSSLPSPDDGSKLLANIHNVTVRANNNGGSPITLIEGYFEDYSTENNYGSLLQSTADLNSSDTNILSINANMTDVDRDRDLIRGYRQYSFKITKIIDEAGNEIIDGLTGTSLPNILYYVFANGSDLTGSNGSYDITTNELNINSNIADGSNKSLIITLKDTYGNEIVNASDINREIDFNFNVTNNLTLNQFEQNGDAVFLDQPSNPGIYLNQLSSSRKFVNELSDDGTYKYDFRIYTPTYSSTANDGRQWVNGNMTIHNIDYEIRQDISSYIGGSYDGTIVDSDIEFLFKPLYTSEFKGDLVLGIFAGTVQNAQLDVKVNNSTITSNSSIRLGFGQTNGASNNIIHPNYDLVYEPNSNENSIIEGHQANIYNLQNVGTLPGDKDFDVKITQTSGSVDSSLATYISSHIVYDLDGKTVAYDSHTIGKIRYVDGTNLENTGQVGLKVLGIIQSKTQADITTNQSGTDLYALGNNSKSFLKELIRKQASLETKNIQGAISGTVTNLTGDTWHNSNNGTRLRNNTILYFDVAAGTNIQIGNGTDLVAEGIKTIIVKGGNIYMKENITYQNNGSDMLGIISLSDDEGNGGNIYLDTEVTNLSGVYYADKSLISYDGLNEIDGSVGTNILKNQFYLFGTLFSENTIGGSIIPKCPYYVTNICDINEARKYDLNFLRRYFTYDDDDIDTLENNIYNGGSSYFTYGNTNFSYPIIIEYNSNVQSTPPPLFENNDF